jgi:serpin B
VQLVELPYGSGQDFGAVIILPRKGSTNSVGGLTTHALRNPGEWDKWVNRLPKRDVELYLPRFKLEYGVKDIKAALGSMGLEEAFIAGLSGHESGFARMTDDPSVYLSNVFHKVWNITVLPIPSRQYSNRANPSNRECVRHK